MIKSTTGALAAVLALGAGSAAMAQQSYNNPAAGPPATSGPHREVDVIGDLLYNSNVAATDAQLAAARGLTLEDEIFTPSILLNLSHPIGVGQIFLTGNAGYAFYANNTILNREVIDLAGGVSGRWLLCQETLSGNISRQQSDLNQQTIVTVKNTVATESVNLSGTCGRDVGFSPNFSVSQLWKTNSAELDQINNERTFTAVAGLAYRRPTFGSLGLFGEFDEITFDNRTIYVGNQSLTSGFDNYTVGLRYVRQFGSRLQTTAAISYTDLEPFLGGVGYEGFTYSADGTYKAGSRLSFHADFSRATAPSTFFYANFSINTTEQADATFVLSGRIKMQLLGSIENETYHGALLDPGIELTDQTIYNIMGTATYAFNPRISLALRLGGQKRDANQPGLSYSNFQAGLQAKAAF
jgi:hypothetical protein